MKTANFISVCLVAFVAFIFVAADAEAQRYRKGRRSGRERQQEQPQQQPQPQPQRAPVVRKIDVELIVRRRGRNMKVSDPTITVKTATVEFPLTENDEGKYHITLTEGDSAQVQISAPGYKDNTVVVGTDRKTVEIEMDIVETVSGVRSEDVSGLDLDNRQPAEARIEYVPLSEVTVVSATKSEQKISEAPAVISIVTAQQIKQRGYRTVAEALNSLPGIDMLYDNAKYNMGIRGINSGQRGWSNVVKLMIDNQPVSFRSSNENWLGFELIPIEMVDRIEVIRGPSSAVYGANAFLGAVNIITKKGDQLDGGIATVRGMVMEGNPGGNVTAAYGKKINKFDIVAAGSYANLDRSGMTPGNLPNQPLTWSPEDEADQSANDLYRPMNLFTRVGYSDESIGNISLDFNYQLLDVNGEFQDWSVLSKGENRMVLRNYYARARYNKEINDRWTVNGSVAHASGKPTSNDQLTNFDEEVIRRDYGFSSIDLAGDLSYGFKDVNRITFGADYTNDNQTLQSFYRETDQGLQYNLISEALGTQNFANAGLYAQGIVYPFQLMNYTNSLRTLGFTAGLRADLHNIYGDVLNYRINAVYQPLKDNDYVKDFYIKLLYGTSFRAPAASQLYTNFIQPFGVLGNENLDPEEARTLELSVGGQAGRFLNLSVNGFLTNVSNQIQLIQPVGESNVRPQNINEIRSYGFETELNTGYKWIKGYVNYSYQVSTTDDGDDRTRFGDQTLRDTMGLYANHLFKFGVNAAYPDFFLNFNLEGIYTGSRTASEQNIRRNNSVNFNRYQLDPFFLLNLTVSTVGLEFWEGKESLFEFKVYNLLNTEYFHPGFSFNRNLPDNRNIYEVPGLDAHFHLRFTQYF